MSSLLWGIKYQQLVPIQKNKKKRKRYYSCQHVLCFVRQFEFGAKDSHITCRGPLPFWSSCTRNGTPFFINLLPRQPSTVRMLLNRNDQQQGCPSYKTDLSLFRKKVTMFQFPPDYRITDSLTYHWSPVKYFRQMLRKRACCWLWEIVTEPSMIWSLFSSIGSNKYKRVCCQWVGASSGAVERTIETSGFLFLLLGLAFWVFSSNDWLGCFFDFWRTGPLNSTSNQNAKPCNGAVSDQTPHVAHYIPPIMGKN